MGRYDRHSAGCSTKKIIFLAEGTKGGKKALLLFLDCQFFHKLDLPNFTVE
jgi:hypothetical protein